MNNVQKVIRGEWISILIAVGASDAHSIMDARWSALVVGGWPPKNNPIQA